MKCSSCGKNGFYSALCPSCALKNGSSFSSAYSLSSLNSILASNKEKPQQKETASFSSLSSQLSSFSSSKSTVKPDQDDDLIKQLESAQKTVKKPVSTVKDSTIKDSTTTETTKPKTTRKRTSSTSRTSSSTSSSTSSQVKVSTGTSVPKPDTRSSSQSSSSRKAVKKKKKERTGSALSGFKPMLIIFIILTATLVLLYLLNYQAYLTNYDADTIGFFGFFLIISTIASVMAIVMIIKFIVSIFARKKLPVPALIFALLSIALVYYYAPTFVIYFMALI